MPNENCLAGLACPKCGQEDELLISANIVCKVTDEGSEPTGDHYWDEDSVVVCPVCETTGKLKEFMIVNQPAWLKHVKAGDIVTRMLGGTSPMNLKVTLVDEFIHCGPWKFSKNNGAEIDEDLGWTEEHTGSYLKPGE